MNHGKNQKTEKLKTHLKHFHLKKIGSKEIKY